MCDKDHVPLLAICMYVLIIITGSVFYCMFIYMYIDISVLCCICMYRYDEALQDFKEAMGLDHTLNSPHICGGLIYMTQKKDFPQAITCFSSAINNDPTCLRAYLCRAEAYKRAEKVRLCVWVGACVYNCFVIKFSN